jgi:hypothetical protein
MRWNAGRLQEGMERIPVIWWGRKKDEGMPWHSSDQMFGVE